MISPTQLSAVLIAAFESHMENMNSINEYSTSNRFFVEIFHLGVTSEAVENIKRVTNELHAWFSKLLQNMRKEVGSLINFTRAFASLVLQTGSLKFRLSKIIISDGAARGNFKITAGFAAEDQRERRLPWKCWGNSSAVF